MGTEKTKKDGWIFLLGALIYIAAVTWINFHSAQWYNFDMFADAAVARRMAEQHSLFPEGWIFGNQYYVIATPVVAALFYLICHNTVLAMALATTLMYALILLSFYWCTKELFSKTACRIGLFCMAGATILGDSVSSCTYGFQIFYSMASYYACYLLVILLHLGIWVRISRRRPVSIPVTVIALLSSFALGIQSPRELLSLCIPLWLISLLLLLRKKARPQIRSFEFAAASLGMNLLGLLFNGLIRRTWEIQFASNVQSRQASFSLSGMLDNMRESLQAFLDLVGLRYLTYNWKWKPIAFLGIFLLLVCLLAQVDRLRRKESRGAADPLLFCWLSLLCVFGAGIFVVQVRAIYYFVWYLLVPLSVASLAESLSRKKRTVLGVAVLLCGTLNFVFNFYPDLGKYAAQCIFYQEIENWMKENEISTIYGDYQAPTISAFSGDSICYSSVFPNLSAEIGENGLISPYGSPVDVRGYRNVDPEHSVLVLSESPYDSSSGYRYLQEHASEDYMEAFEKQFSLETDFVSPYITYYIYSFEKPDIFPEGSIP